MGLEDRPMACSLRKKKKKLALQKHGGGKTPENFVLEKERGSNKRAYEVMLRDKRYTWRKLENKSNNRDG